MTTKLKVKNSTAEGAVVWITLGATDGCVQNVGDLVLSGNVQVNAQHALQGFFAIMAGETVEVSAPEGMGLNGNFAFNTPPLNCPTPEFPEGVCLAEFIINNGFQVNGQETVDISCVCGANAYLGFDLSASDWNNGCGAMIRTIRNSEARNNTGRSGVYPMGCDNCTASVAPPECIGLHPEYANTQPICNVQRPASGNMGGEVLVVFLGMTPVPA